MNTSVHLARPLALVTGGARGYGVAVARTLAASGFRVGVLARSVSAIEPLNHEFGAIPVVADIRDREAVISGVKTLVAGHGDIEVLVNNAGVPGTLAPVWEADPDAWWEAFEVNLRGTHTVTAAVVTEMLKGFGPHRIINVVSHAGVHRWPLCSSYAVSKAALIKYGENLATELRRSRIAVLNYHPGIMDAGMTHDLLAQDDPAEGLAMIVTWFRNALAAGNGVDPAASAATLARLASGAADCLSGCYLTAYDDLDQVLRQTEAIRTSGARTLGLLGVDSGQVR